MIEDRINLTEYSEGFNQGMQAAADRFELYIFILVGLYAFRIFIQLPFVHRKIDDLTDYDLYGALDVGTDVLAFFIVAILLHALLGEPIIAPK
jgi:hypothetical protein